ncbi:MAG: lamin tail domain-containing protein [Candidatus Omnitrophica bacterium]|nr:lamin tail domain-containing protein [Candidatus Omnitrophota bacterium]MDD5553543.1 lamin tail domain-containing protein [Candidatus Omnitrophota bacterium]
MKRIKGCRDKGQALMVVITVLVMLFAITMAFFVLSQTEKTAAMRHLDSLKAQYIAEAGVIYAKKVLEQDRSANPIDSLEDSTFKNFEGQDMDMDGDGVNDSKWLDLSDSEGNPFGRFSVMISDESSRFNLNSAPAEILGRFFAESGIESSKLNQLLARRPFNAKEEVSAILGSADYNSIKESSTIYSRDLEIDLHRERKKFLNTLQPRLVLEGFLDSGVNSAYKKAANLKDASDTDVIQTIFDKFSKTFTPTTLLEPGGWRRIANFYEAYPSDDDPGEFIFSDLGIEDGDYYCFLYGPLNTDVVTGDPPALSGEGLGEMVTVLGNTLSLSIKPAKNTTSRFSYIELMSANFKGGLERRTIAGTEALVLNELMCKPSKELPANAPAHIDPGQTKDWSFTQIKPGYYYVSVEALMQGGLVGDVTISGRTSADIRDKDYFSNTVYVDVSGAISVRIKNNSLGDASFKGIKILQEPDGEFIEILNLSPDPIDLSDFSLEAYTAAGELVSGWPARVPAGTEIEPYQHLVLAIDSGDASPSPQNLRSNHVYFESLYGAPSIGLIFEEAASAINRDSDLLPDAGGRIILRDAQGERIDAVEYSSGQLGDFISIERGDPTEDIDGDGDGLFDGWRHSAEEGLCTPASLNENPGMYTPDENGELVKNNVNQITLFNRPLTALSEVEQLSSGQAWKKCTSMDLANMADHFSILTLDLDMEGKEIEGGSGTTGVWEFTQIPQGNYLLSVLSGNEVLQGGQILLSVKTSIDSDFTQPVPLLFVQGSAFYGNINIAEDLSILQVKITVESEEEKTALQKLRLEPVYTVDGRININTASEKVLRSLFISESMISQIKNTRPIGAKDLRLLGVGELFILDPAFIPFYNYLTVKSDTYEIKCRGDFLQQGKTLAYQTIRSVLERGE